MRTLWILAVLLAGQVGVARAQPVSFELAPSHPAGTNPASPVIGDFNGDAIPDLAVANLNTQGLSVLLGTGGGDFGPAIQYGAGGSPFGLAAGDFNGDGALDLVVTIGGGPAGVMVLFGTGSGTFGAPVPAGSPGAQFVAVADLNGDSFLDLAITGSPVADAVGIMLGTGLGTFGAPTSYPVGSFPQKLAVADLSGDGIPDIVTGNVYSGDISVLIGIGNGTFGAAVNYPATFYSNDVVVADLVGDALPDVVVTANCEIHVFPGTGGGALGPATVYSIDFCSRNLAVGEFDGDAHLDLATTTFFSVGVMAGSSSGGLGTAVHHAGSDPGGIAAGDLDGDGLSDIVAADFLPGTVSIFLRRDAATFRAPRGFAVGPGYPDIAVATLGSGSLDVVVANPLGDDVSVMLNAGGGVLAPPTTHPAGPYPESVRASDMNGDGLQDLVVTNLSSGSVSVLLASGGGAFGSPVSYPAPDARSLAMAFLNADAFPDVVTAGAAAGDISVLLGDGSGGLGAPVDYELGLTYDAGRVATADFNGDGFPDVVAISDLVVFAPGTGTGAFGPPILLDVTPTYYYGTLAVGDLNLDGRPDIALGSQSRVTVLLGHGDGSFAEPLYRPISGDPDSLAVADFDADGFPDLVVADAFNGKVSVLPGTGTGVFLPPHDFTVAHAAALAVGDFDVDARPDLAVAVDYGGQGRNAAWILRNSTVPQAADLGVVVDDGSTQAVPGGPISYAVTVTNNGPGTVAALIAISTPPPEILDPTMAASAGAYDPATGLWTGLSLGSSQSATLTLSGHVATNAAGTLTYSVGVTTIGAIDTNSANNIGSDTDSVVPAADLALDLTGSATPVQPGSSFTYTLTVTNNGPVVASGVLVAAVLPAAVTFASSASCTEASGTVTCDVGALAASASLALTFDVTANPGYASAFSTASVAGALLDPIASNNSATDETIIDVGIGIQLTHGSAWVRDLAALPGPAPHRDLFRLTQEPHSSYEVLVDSVTGDLAAPGNPIRLQRLDVDMATVLQDALPIGTGFSRSLRFQNATSQPVSYQTVAVSSGGCATDCDASDTYRVRIWDTTCSASRFSNSDSQVTVLVVQNLDDTPVGGTVWLWNAAGEVLASQPFTVTARGALFLDTSSVAPGAGGSLTISHDGRYGQLTGKAVAVEPATGFTFDTEIRTRPR